MFLFCCEPNQTYMNHTLKSYDINEIKNILHF